MSLAFESTATTTTIYMVIPEGPLVTGRVKEVLGTPANPKGVHPGDQHEWHEVDHYGEYGTGFAMCRCGAMGVPYGRP